MFQIFRRKNDTISRAAASNVIGQLVDHIWNSATTLTWSRLFGTLNHERQYADQSSASLRLSAVMCAMNIYTGMVQALPRRMYALDSETGEKTRIVGTTAHPASRIFSHYFHPELSADNGLLAIIYDVLMDGNAYFVREFDNQGRTARLYYVHPSRIPRGNIFRASGSERLSNGRTAAQGELVYRIDTGQSSRDINTQPLMLSRSEVVHIKGKVIDTEYHRGQGFIANASDSLHMYQAAEDFGQKFYTRGIATQMFLTTENRLAPEVLKRIEANFEEDPNAPLESIFKTRILEQGLKPVHMGIPFQHLQFIETRAFSIEDVARNFNIPPVLLHSHMGTKGGDVNLSEAIAMFVQTGIGPFLVRLCNEFRSELLPLPSQMLYSFEFEQLYLYRNVIDKFTIALRNLFETGIVDRKKASDLLGMHIDPGDAAANPRYVPVNLMTVEHSLHLEEGARIANEMQRVQIESAQTGIEMQKKTIAGMVPAPAPSAGTGDGGTNKQPEPPSGRMDKSPSQKGIDKRLRNLSTEIADKVSAAVNNVISGLAQYETRVLDQKKQSRPDDYDAAVSEFYAADGRFATMLNEQLKPWDSFLAESVIPTFVNQWLMNKAKPEFHFEWKDLTDGSGSDSES